MKGLCVYLNIICIFNTEHLKAGMLVVVNPGDYDKNVGLFFFILICLNLEYKECFPKYSLYNHYFKKRF